MTDKAALTREKGDDGVLVVTIDVPGQRLNTLSKERIAELEALLDDVERDTSARAVVVRSGKPAGFVAGADIKDFTRLRSAEEAEALSRAGQAVFDRVAAARVPIVAAIHGACLGGGTELVLACRYRVASDDPKTVLALPEVKLGLLPGAGGSQRLPRLVGLANALDLILSGRSLSAKRAEGMGLVDAVCPAPILVDVARRAALALAEGSLRPRRKGITLRERLLRPVIFWKARSEAMAKGGEHYPALLTALEVVRRGTATSLAQGLRLEAAAFGRLSATDVSRNLVSVFFATQEVKKDAGYPEGTKAGETATLGVLGAGLMGAGIAAAAADVGVSVRIKDATYSALGRGLRQARGVWDEQVKKHRLTKLELQQRVDRVSPTIDYSGFRRAEIVIEAVFEDLELKRRVLAEVERATAPDCVYASNTSSIPIGEIARGCRRPGQVLGMHFFSPVHKMPLLEVIATSNTSDATLATAVSFGRRLGKHVIVVRDGPGFYTTRALAAYLNEAAWLLEEGAAIEQIDGSGVAFGFPVGPMTLADEVGIDVVEKVGRVMHQHFGPRMAPPPSIARVVADGRQGRKNARGFYTYGGAKKRVDQSVYAALPGGAIRRRFEQREVQERLVFAFLNEAILCLDQGILRSARDGDVGAIFGLGFPPFLGGPFRHLDHLGAPFALETLEKLAAKHGSRFQPAPLLVEMARGGRAFHATTR